MPLRRGLHACKQRSRPAICLLREEIAMPEPATPKAQDLRKQTVEIKRSAKAVARSTTELTDSAARRTILASDRTLLAAERTYAAWVRTALAALASGVGARAIMADILPALVGKLTGTVLVVFAGFCLVAAVWRELQGAVAEPLPDIRPLPHALLVPMNAFLLLVAVAALVGIWSG
jgi:putative membrane protein